jgi:hypothetical protein
MNCIGVVPRCGVPARLTNTLRLTRSNVLSDSTSARSVVHAPGTRQDFSSYLADVGTNSDFRGVVAGRTSWQIAKDATATCILNGRTLTRSRRRGVGRPGYEGTNNRMAANKLATHAQRK